MLVLFFHNFFLFHDETSFLFHSNIQSWQMHSLPTLDPYVFFWKILPLDGDFFLKLRMCVNMFTLSVLWLNVNWTFLEVLLLLWCNSSIVQLILLDKIHVLVNLAGILAFSNCEHVHAKLFCRVIWLDRDQVDLKDILWGKYFS